MSFVHLHVHSHYSLLQSSCTVPDLIDKCAEYKMKSLALTDYGNMFGALEFYFAALNKNIKPILGCEVYYVDNKDEKDKLSGDYFRNPMKRAKTLVLLAKNQEGYKNLCHINTLAYQEGFYFVPRVDYQVLDQYKEGLIALTGAQRGRLSHIYQNQGVDPAVKEIDQLQKIFGNDLYLQFHPKGISDCKKYNTFLAEMSASKNIPLVAGNDVHYVNKEDSIVQDVLFCIGTNRTLNDRERSRLGPSEFYFKDSNKMHGLFSDCEFSGLYKEACERTLEISDQCSIHFKVKDEKGKPIYHIPQTKEKRGTNLKNLSLQGLEDRFKEAELRSEPIPEEKKQDYKDRLDYELKIIEGMGFNGYFHIVQDFIRWSKDQGIPVGPGRGSGASSLVSYSLGITNLDPMPLNLIFERFLNPERISMPDFDIDFCWENRSRVIEYINEKYGSDCTSHVITYGRLNVRAAIRDVGRVLGLNYGDVDRIAKLIPDILGITLEEALKKEPRIKNLGDEDPQIAELIQLTGMLEGLIRNVGIHAAGIIIADTPIKDYAPLYKGPDGENVIQYDLKHAEKIGLVKFDFLGLKTLTHIKETIQLIKQTRGEEIKIQNISLKDSGIYQVMCQGDTMGVFQFEGHGITDLLTQAQPTCFEDIVAINALYRPGPMNMIPSYLDRKKGRVPVDYIFPALEPILKETYGIIVYQEQVQQIAVEIAGYSYGEADMLRRAMSKKIKSEMARQKIRFLEGAGKKNYNQSHSEKLFDLMAEFAKYGFNKSHAAAYCVLAAQTAWLKQYYSIEFFASQLSIDQSDSDKLSNYIRNIKTHKIPIISPNINTSSYKFSIEKDRIHFSLTAIKGVGESAARTIVKIREDLPGKKFDSLEQFFEKISGQTVNKKALESLIKAGALDGFGYQRKELYENIEKFTKYSSQLKEDKETGQQSLFDTSLEEQNRVKISPATPWTEREKLYFEKEVFGFYLNNHPMNFLKNLDKVLSYEKLKTLEKLKVKFQPVKTYGKAKYQAPSIKTLGMVQNIKEVVTKKKGQVMAFGQLEDGSGCLEVIFFPEAYEKCKPMLVQESEILFFKGHLQNERSNINRFIVEEVSSLDDFLKQVKMMKIELDPSMKKQDLNEIKQILRNSKKGDSQLRIETRIPAKASLSDEGTIVEIDTPGLTHGIEVNYKLLEKMYKVLKTTEKIHFS